MLEEYDSDIAGNQELAKDDELISDGAHCPYERFLLYFTCTADSKTNSLINESNENCFFFFLQIQSPPQ